MHPLNIWFIRRCWRVDCTAIINSNLSLRTWFSLKQIQFLSWILHSKRSNKNMKKMKMMMDRMKWYEKELLAFCFWFRCLNCDVLHVLKITITKFSSYFYVSLKKIYQKNEKRKREIHWKHAIIAETSILFFFQHYKRSIL